MNVTVTTRPVIGLMQQTMTAMVMMSSMAKVKKEHRSAAKLDR